MIKITVSSVSNYKLEWNDQGSGADMDGSFYDPVAPRGWYFVGSYAENGYRNPTGPSQIVRVENDDPNYPALAAPVDYEGIWNDQGSGADRDGSMWHPVPPDGYITLGDVCTSGYDKPTLSAYRCIRADLATPGLVGQLIWNDMGSGADHDGSFWEIVDHNGLATNNFIAQRGYDRPAGAQVFTLQRWTRG